MKFKIILIFLSCIASSVFAPENPLKQENNNYTEKDIKAFVSQELTFEKIKEIYEKNNLKIISANDIAAGLDFKDKFVFNRTTFISLEGFEAFLRDFIACVKNNDTRRLGYIYNILDCLFGDKWQQIYQ